MNTRQIPGRDKIGSLAPGKYTQFEGTEISIENCVKAKVKDLVVEGKTYQNLVSNLDELVGNVYTTSKYASIPTKMFKTNTTYTVITTINESVYSSTKFGALLVIKYTTIGDSYIPISLVDGTFKIKFTTGAENPTNIRLQVHGANDTTSSFKLDNLVILEGDYITKELPDSINGIESVAEREGNVFSIVNNGKNLFNPNNLVNQSGYVDETIFPSFTPILERNKVIFRNASRGIACKFYAHKNDILYLSGTVENLTNIRIFTESANFQGMGIMNFGLDVRKTELNHNKHNVCIPEDGYYYIRCWINTSYADAILTNFIAQLNSQYPYEPYREPSVTTLNFPIPLRALPNGVADTIEGDKLVQRVGIRTFDGSEDWRISSINNNENGLLNIYCSITDVVSKDQNKQSLMCDKYIQQTTGISYTNAEGVVINIEKRLYLRLFIDKATTIAEAKEYIKNNPFTVYYELATPIIHDLEVPDMSTTKGTNIITTTNNIKPKLSMKVKVKK